MKTIARAAFWIAVVALVCLLLGPLLARFGVVPPLVGFSIFALHIPVALVALVCGLLGVYVNWKEKGAAPKALWGALLGSLLLLVVPLFLRPPDVPPIHDISTDIEEAPAFSALAKMEHNADRDLTFPHGSDDALEQHRIHYGDLEGKVTDLRPGDALVRAGVVATNLGWDVVSTDTDAGLLEATATSGIFRFVDDIVVRVRPVYGPSAVAASAAETGGEVEAGEVPAAPAPPRVVGSIVDVRSTSRVGQSDLGANAARIREFLERF